MTDKICFKCGEKAVEIVVINFDYQHGIARCKACFDKMRLKDYYYWEEHDRITKGGRV